VATSILAVTDLDEAFNHTVTELNDLKDRRIIDQLEYNAKVAQCALLYLDACKKIKTIAEETKQKLEEYAKHDGR